MEKVYYINAVFGGVTRSAATVGKKDLFKMLHGINQLTDDGDYVLVYTLEKFETLNGDSELIAITVFEGNDKQLADLMRQY